MDFGWSGSVTVFAITLVSEEHHATLVLGIVFLAVVDDRHRHVFITLPVLLQLDRRAVDIPEFTKVRYGAVDVAVQRSLSV
jgi:hypothetical protein